MQFETFLDVVVKAFYAVIVSGILTFVVGWAISWTIQPGFARWVLPLVFLGLFLAFGLGAGIPLFALGHYQLGWLWPIRAISVIVSIAVSLFTYWWGAHSFTTRRTGT